MTAQVEHNRDQLQDAMERLVPAVERLLRSTTRSEPYQYHGEEQEIRMAVALQFDDGIGNGELVAKLHRYRGAIRLDLQIEHDREFAASNGKGSGIRCFLNDYVASVELPLEQIVLPREFVRSVVSGVAAALSAVSRHNRLHPEPWFKVRVAARDSAWTSLMRDIL